MDQNILYAHRGKASLVWDKGQLHRLEVVSKIVDLSDKKILDVGCGVGAYVGAFSRYSKQVYGIEPEDQYFVAASAQYPHIVQAKAEHLPFEDNTFDVVFLNEVIEHVEDDHQTIQEAVRVLRKGGHVIIFAPNRWFPFETHGMFIGKRYMFGNIPLLNYLPLFIRNVFVPHARCYTVSSIKKLFPAGAVRYTFVGYVYPAFDRMSRRLPFLTGVLKNSSHHLETLPLIRKFGLSILLVAEKN